MNFLRFDKHVFESEVYLYVIAKLNSIFLLK